MRPVIRVGEGERGILLRGSVPFPKECPFLLRVKQRKPFPRPIRGSRHFFLAWMLLPSSESETTSRSQFGLIALTGIPVKENGAVENLVVISSLFFIH